jgi:hypothetical protein
MKKHHPDGWTIFQFDVPGEPILLKIFATWRGVMKSGDSRQVHIILTILVTTVRILNGSRSLAASITSQRMRMVPLQIIPHPKNVEHPTAIKLDFGMENGMLEVNVRAAMAGYLLRRWNVDCSENGSLSGSEYQLCLQNIQTLYGADNLSIAPGYQNN